MCIRAHPFNSYYFFGSLDALKDFLTTQSLHEVDNQLNLENVIQELIKYQSTDGGFSPVPAGLPEMYETFRVLYSLEYIRRTFKRNYLTEVDDTVVEWILSCEDSKGGFSWIPNKRAYVQPTYHALECLRILGVIDEIDKEKHIKWILRFQNNDGGFNGGEEHTPSDLHFTFWVLRSLDILINSN